MASKMAQVAKESNALSKPHFAEAARRTKEYVASIADDPKACPMFPPVDEHSCGIETLSYVQGYLAGLIVSGGRTPTKAEMDEIYHDVMHDPAVSDMVVKMLKSEKTPPEGPFPSEY